MIRLDKICFNISAELSDIRGSAKGMSDSSADILKQILTSPINFPPKLLKKP
jgi:hypothetical protein